MGYKHSQFLLFPYFLPKYLLFLLLVQNVTSPSTDFTLAPDIFSVFKQYYKHSFSLQIIISSTFSCYYYYKLGIDPFREFGIYKLQSNQPKTKIQKTWAPLRKTKGQSTNSASLRQIGQPLTIIILHLSQAIYYKNASHSCQPMKSHNSLQGLNVPYA